MSDEKCSHLKPMYDLIDQAVGVVCNECNTVLEVEWMDETISDQYLKTIDPTDFFNMDHVWDVDECERYNCIVCRIRKLQPDKYPT